MYLFFKDA